MTRLRFILACLTVAALVVLYCTVAFEIVQHGYWRPPNWVIPVG